ncbi:MAG: hypothetical protein RLZZ435_1438 [Cyanobacteriota bacterium]|jgi:hypothetical protein
MLNKVSLTVATALLVGMGTLTLGMESARSAESFSSPEVGTSSYGFFFFPFPCPRIDLGSGGWW